MTAPAVLARDVAKVYRRFMHRNQFKTLKSALLTGSVIRDLTPDQTFTALDGVSFEVPKGTTFGVIGENGSGKSTMLKLLAGITKPTRGSLRVEGRVSALIELGAGFHPEISGRENVAINGIMLGLSRREVQERFHDIVAFAELERFIDAPVKTYSSGMYARLGFAVAIHVDPDVLLIDEVLAVGDEAFTRKCLDKIGEFRRRGKTILLVTHSLGLAEKMCDEVLWLRQGKLADHGDPKRVIDAYLTYVAGGEEALLAREHGQPAAGPDAGAPATAPGEPPSGRRLPGGAVGEPRDRDHLRPSARRPRPRAPRVRARREPHRLPGRDRARARRRLRVRRGRLQRGWSRRVRDQHPHRGVHAPAGGRRRARSPLALQDLRLVEGTYLLDVAAHRRDGTPYDYHRGLYTFRMKSRIKDVGVYRPAHRWSFSGGIALTAPQARAELDLHESEDG